MITLPNTDHESDFQLIMYENPIEIIKQRISFTQNVFSFLIDGNKTIYSQNSKSLSHQEFALITSSSCLMTEKKSSSSSSYKSLLLFFSNKALKNFQLNHSQIINSSKSEYIQLSDTVAFPYDEYCNTFRESLLKLSQMSGDLRNKILECKFNEIMLYLMAKYPEEILSILQNTNITHEMKFRSSIEANIHHSLSIEELAFLCNMSASTFKRYFKLYYKTPPQKYILSKRMNLARLLIENGERGVDIYNKVGYQKHSNFIKAYKTYFGISPGKRN